MSDSDDEVHELRAQQSRIVMPMIGILLDAWNQLPNDTKDVVRSGGPLGTLIERIASVMEHPEQPQPLALRMAYTVFLEDGGHVSHTLHDAIVAVTTTEQPQHREGE